MLSLQILSSDPTLNSFTTNSTYSFVAGSDCDIFIRLNNPDLKLRFIPSSSAALSVTLLNSDQTTITKALTIPFADDRSIWKFSLTVTESLTVIGQNLVMTLVDGGKTQIIILKNGLSKTGTACC